VLTPQGASYTGRAVHKLGYKFLAGLFVTCAVAALMSKPSPAANGSTEPTSPATSVKAPDDAASPAAQPTQGAEPTAEPTTPAKPVYEMGQGFALGSYDYTITESIKNRVQRCWMRPAGLGKPSVIP
jgi:hypothetical protein